MGGAPPIFSSTLNFPLIKGKRREGGLIFPRKEAGSVYEERGNYLRDLKGKLFLSPLFFLGGLFGQGFSGGVGWGG